LSVSKFEISNPTRRTFLAFPLSCAHCPTKFPLNKPQTLPFLGVIGVCALSSATYICTAKQRLSSRIRHPRFLCRNSLAIEGKGEDGRDGDGEFSIIAATQPSALSSSDSHSNLHRHCRRFLSPLGAISTTTTILAPQHAYLQYFNLYPSRASYSDSCSSAYCD
jgi:hypothetical protein